MSNYSRSARAQPDRRGRHPFRARTSQDSLEGKVHPPPATSMAAPRRRGRWLTVGVPSVLGGVFGISSFLVLGVSSLIGGAGLLMPLLGGAGVGLVVGGGLGILLRTRSQSPVLVSTGRAERPAGTRPSLERVVTSTKRQRRHLTRMRRRRPGPAVKPVLRRADTLLQRIDALATSPSLQSRRASDEDVMMLERMASRYVPDLVQALEDTAGFLAPSTGPARERAMANVHHVDEQLAALAREVDRLERDAVDGVARSLEVHSEFLRNRLH